MVGKMTSLKINIDMGDNGHLKILRREAVNRKKVEKP